MVNGTFTGNANSDTYEMPTGGVLGVDLQWESGTLDVALETTLDDSAWVTVANASGTAQSASMATGNRHARFEVLGREGQKFRLTSTNGASTPNVDYAMDRVVASF